MQVVEDRKDWVFLHKEYIKIMYDLPMATHRQTQTQNSKGNIQFRIVTGVGVSSSG